MKANIDDFKATVAENKAYDNSVKKQRSDPAAPLQYYIHYSFLSAILQQYL